MNIIFITRLFTPHIGGVEKHVLNISKELIKQGHRVTVLCESHDPNLQELEIVSNILVLRVPVSKAYPKQKKWMIWKWILKHRNLFVNADVVHIHDVVYWVYPLILSLKLRKFFTTFHGWEGKFPIPKLNIYKKKLDSFLSFGSITVGRFINKWYGIRSDLITYGAGFVANTTLTTKSKNTLLYIGRLSSDTGFKDCINRYQRLKNKLNWNLTIVGEGELISLVPNDALYLSATEDVLSIIQTCKYIYASGYLSVLEGFLSKKILLASFDNDLKKDYWLFHPMASEICFTDSVPRMPSGTAFKWAKSQTWEHLSSEYLKLWKK